MTGQHNAAVLAMIASFVWPRVRPIAPASTFPLDTAREVASCLTCQEASLSIRLGR